MFSHSKKTNGKKKIVTRPVKIQVSAPKVVETVKPAFDISKAVVSVEKPDVDMFIMVEETEGEED